MSLDQSVIFTVGKFSGKEKKILEKEIKFPLLETITECSYREEMASAWMSAIQQQSVKLGIALY